MYFRLMAAIVNFGLIRVGPYQGLLCNQIYKNSGAVDVYESEQVCTRGYVL